MNEFDDSLSEQWLVEQIANEINDPKLDYATNFTDIEEYLQQKIEIPEFSKFDIENLNPITKTTRIYLNMHGFTTLGAAQCFNRLFKTLSPDINYHIEFNLGKGKHSEKGLSLNKCLSQAIKIHFNKDIPVKQNSNNEGRYILSIKVNAAHR